jgi:hypothetical protein
MGFLAATGGTWSAIANMERFGATWSAPWGPSSVTISAISPVVPLGVTNQRNDTSGKTVLTNDGPVPANQVVDPAATLQTCIVHLILNRLEFANRKERKPLAAALRAICTAPSRGGPRGVGRLCAGAVGPALLDRRQVVAAGVAARRPAVYLSAGGAASAHHWRAALSQFAIVFEDRFLKPPCPPRTPCPELSPRTPRAPCEALPAVYFA